MEIVYKDNIKELPIGQLFDLFDSVGWVDKDKGTDEMKKHFNAPFLNSTLVVSAWDGEVLVGVVRVLSDKIIRSIIYDLAVLPQYQNYGIGKELLKRCIEHYPNSEWLVQTEFQIAKYYENNGFTKSKEIFLTKPFNY